MATNYKIAGADVDQEPNEAVYEPIRVVGIDHTGAPHFGPYRVLMLTFDVMTEANFAEWQALEDGLPHAMTLPHPDTGAFTAFASLYLTVSRARRADINVYDVELQITRIPA